MMGNHWLLGIAVAGLAACATGDGAGLRAGVDGAAQIRAAMGEPTTVWKAADGSATWEYARHPEGRRTFMVHMGADGRLQKIEQVMAPEVFSRVVVGKTTKDEVRRLLGQPYLESQFPRKGELVWDYRYWDAMSGFGSVFHVSFNSAGVVAGTVTTIDDGRYLQSGPGKD